MKLRRDPPPELVAAYPDAPFVPFAAGLDVNWSADLEAMHEEPSRDHFLDVRTRTAILDALQAADVCSTSPTLLDAGCSSGYLLEDLRNAYPGASLIGVDLVAAGLYRAYENAPQAELLLADACDLPLQDETVDALVSANLLEHVPDDVTALREFHRILRPGGTAAIVVPAGQGLYDYYDGYLGHERRYGHRELARKARAAGFQVTRDAFLGSLVYPPFWVTKKRNRRRHRTIDETEARRLVARSIDRTRGSRLGDIACSVERVMMRHGVGLPFGIRGLTVLRRPD